MQLYIVPGSPNCRKVQAVAHEVGADLEVHLIDFATGAHKMPDYLAINPNGLVPALVDGALRLWESNAIMQYLADAPGGERLYPRDPKQRADVDRWLFWESCHFGRHLAGALYERLFRPLMGGVPDEEAALASLERFAPFAAVLEGQLESGPFVTGEDLTLADYALASQLPLTPLGDVDLAPYPSMGRWLARLDARPAWQWTATPEPLLQALEAARRPHLEPHLDAQIDAQI